MKPVWPLFLAWKQLFPSQKKVSFFSMLAIVGVALGVNVMIVVVAFMQGFQQKFRSDIIDAQGHARAVPLDRGNSTGEGTSIRSLAIRRGREVVSLHARTPTCPE